MKALLITLLKVLALCLTLWLGQTAGNIIGALVLHPPAMQTLNDGPLGLYDGMAVVYLAMAVVMALLAAHLRGSYLTRAGSLFAVYYGVATLQALIEAVYFNTYLKLADSTLWLIGAGSFIGYLPAVAVATWLWKGRPGAPVDLTGHLWKMPVIAVLYVGTYFAAGTLIAWQGEAVRAYYQQAANINVGELALLQVGRGLIWGAMAWIGARWLSGGAWQSGVAVGLAFATFMAIQLLLPSSFMPWDVRKFHLIEVFSSNFLFGLTAVAIWRMGSKAAPSTAASQP